MANKRMFSKQITNADAFLDMPVSSQLLYFHLNMEADDDGFVSNPKRVMRTIGAGEDDLKVLLTKRFLLSFENGVVVIKHWLLHNAIRKDMYKETQYLDEKKRLKLKDNNVYTEVRNEPVTVPLHRLDQIRIDQDRLDKDKTATKVAYNEEDLELSKLLLEKIRGNTPTFKEPNIEKWADHVRLMRERDERTPEQIKFIIEWCQKDNFWQANILSTEKLRAKFDTLVSQTKRSINITKTKSRGLEI